MRFLKHGPILLGVTVVIWYFFAGLWPWDHILPGAWGLIYGIKLIREEDPIV